MEPKLTTKKPSGAQNRKRKADKEALAVEKKMQDKLDLLSSWNANQDSISRMYGSGFQFLNKPVLDPDEIRRALELPIYGIEPPKVLRVIREILQLQTKGYFLAPADFCDAILRDEKIYAFLQVRINAIIGSKINLEPADDSDKAKELQEEIEKVFTKLVPLNEVGEMLRWALLLGTSISQILWDTKDGMWCPRISVWHPKYMYYNWALYQFRIVTADYGELTVAPEDIQWSLFSPYSEHLPWNRGLVIPLATIYLIRTWLLQWWARHQERNGQPIIGAVTSAEATPEEEKLFIQQLTTLSSNAVVRLPQGIEGNKFDLKFIQANSDLFKGFHTYLDYIDRSLAQTILGQDKTTMAKTSGMSIGGNEAGESVRLDLMRFDARSLGEHLREKILKPYVKFNYGEEFEELAPFIEFDIEEPEDMKSKAEQIKLLSEAFVNFASLTVGQQIDYRAILDDFTLPIVESEKAPPDMPYANTFLEPPDDLNKKENQDDKNKKEELTSLSPEARFFKWRA